LHLSHVPSFPTRRSSDLIRYTYSDVGTGWRVDSRRVSENGTNGGEKVWSYSYVYDDPYASYALKTVVTDPVGGKTMHYFDGNGRSEEHTSELQSRFDLVC